MTNKIKAQVFAIVPYPYCYNCGGKGYIMTDTLLALCPCGIKPKKPFDDLNRRPALPEGDY